MKPQMYDELVSALRNNADHYGFVGNNGLAHLLTDAADAIEDLENKLNLWRQDKISRWIPVTERLPEKEKKSYLCRTDGGYHCEVRWTDNKYGLWSGGGEWGWSIFDIPQYSKVTHWMPLPEPPKEE